MNNEGGFDYLVQKSVMQHSGFTIGSGGSSVS
jgi:hypothetical protein